jgi:peroxiredoxin
MPHFCIQHRLKFALLLGVAAAQMGCNNSSDRRQPASRPAPGPAFLSKFEQVGAGDSKAAEAKTIVCVFARTDCPISNSYAPEVRRMHEKYSPLGVVFYLVYPDPDESAQAIEKHFKDYSYPFAALRDPKHELVKMAEAKITPEAAVFDREGKLLYHGRIDDRYVDFGKARLAPTVHDLERALEAILAGKPAPAADSPAVGCFIADLK